MSEEFIFGNTRIIFSDDIVNYNNLKKRFLLVYPAYVRSFKEWLASTKNLDDILRGAPAYGYGLIYELYGSFGKDFIKMGRYQFNKRDIEKSRLFEYVKEPFIEGLNPLFEAKQNALDTEANEKARREYRKETRSRVVGGGFGVKGAVKGMATAGAINLTTGLAHGAWNAVGNMLTSLEVKGMEDEAFNEGQAGLIKGFMRASYRVLDVLADEFGINPGLDAKKAELILNNLKNGMIDRANIMEAFFEAVKANPYDAALYDYALDVMPAYERALLAIVKYFDVDLGDKYTIYGYTFSCIADKQTADAYLQSVFTKLNTEMEAPGLGEKCFNSNILLANKHLILTNYLLQLMRGLAPANLDRGFLQHLLENFTSIRNKIIEVCNQEGYLVGGMSLQENPDSIALLLAKASVKKTNEHFHFGDIVPAEEFKAFCAEHGINPNVQIYIFCYYSGKMQLNRTDFLFCNEGFYCTSGSNVHAFKAFNDINQICYGNACGIGTSLFVDDNTGIKFSTESQDAIAAGMAIWTIINILTGKQLSTFQVSGIQGQEKVVVGKVKSMGKWTAIIVGAMVAVVFLMVMADGPKERKTTESTPTPVEQQASAPTEAASYPPFTMAAITESYESSADTEGDVVYSAKRAIDGNPKTCWAEGVSDLGLGQGFGFKFNGTYRLRGMYIWIGHQKSEALFYKNARPSSIVVMGSDNSKNIYRLEDRFGKQYVEFEQPIVVDQIAILVNSVVPGTTYMDTSIAEVEFVS